MLILITGGSGSGKSAFAEDTILSFGEGKRYYIATMFPFDKESEKRVERHRKMRSGKGFETIECYTDLKNHDIPSDGIVLLECMSNLVANEMFQANGAGEDTVSAVLDGICALYEKSRHLVIVTNEIFSESACYEGEMKKYQQFLGQINQTIAKMSDQVVEVVYGIPVYYKGKETHT